MSEDRVRVAYEGPIAVITNDNQPRHNAFDDAMDPGSSRSWRRSASGPRYGR